MINVSAQTQRKLLPLKEAIVGRFDAGNWLELGAITGCLDIVQGHNRLLRSLSWGDPDYPGAALTVLVGIVGRNEGHFRVIERYVEEKFGGDGEVVSSKPILGRKIVFAPNAFEVPDAEPDPTLVSVMMPFAAEFKEAHRAIAAACTAAGLKCQRADDIWEHETVIQDIFSLIFRSFIVVCDFTDRNPNVFYEAGIAHTLGKHVVPITQSNEDVPFDLRHHRFIKYLNNSQGLDELRLSLMKRLRTLAGSSLAEYAVGVEVFHQKFGRGMVAEVDGSKVTVDFDKAGRKRIVDVFLGRSR